MDKDGNKVNPFSKYKRPGMGDVLYKDTNHDGIFSDDDRVARGYVVDFFYFKLIDFPVFNVADIYVTVAAFAMIILGLFYYKEEDYNKIFHD